MNKNARTAVFLLLIGLLTMYIIDIPDLYVDIDEAWLGEQAYFLYKDGVVRSEMFSDFLQYDRQILVYHKGFTILGAAFIKLFGFDLFSLRMVSITATALLFMLLYFYCRRLYDIYVFLFAGIILLACPLIFRNSILYRPEPLLAVLGLGSYLSLTRFIEKRQYLFLVLSAVLAGLAVFSHLNGIIFIGAGLVLLLHQKKWKEAAVFFAISIAVGLIYFYDVIGNFELFRTQFIGDPSNPGENTKWSVPITNLLAEHKRIFRKPEIIGITSLFVISAIVSIVRRKSHNYPIIIYAFSLVVLMGLINHNKTTKYAVLYIPYFAILAADHTRNILYNPPEFKKVINILFSVMMIFSLITGILFGIDLIKNGREDIERKSRAIMAQIPNGSRVLAPVRIMFNEIENFDIFGLHPSRLILKERGILFTPENLCRLATEKRAGYIVLNDEYVHELGCPDDCTEEFAIWGFRKIAEVEKHLIFSNLTQ